jgi:NADPH:quinone reductase-like Zn-dependent oxidoreductase
MPEQADTRVVRSLGADGNGGATIFELSQPAPGDGHFWVNTRFSGFSAGTELSFVKGTNPYLHSRWDEDWGVFRAGEPTTTLPVRRLGYMEVGRVAESRSPLVSDGDLVGMAFGHVSGHRADPAGEVVVGVPPGVAPILGIYLAQMGPICANGLLHAAAEVRGTEVASLGDGVAGRHVLVIGAGVVGLLTALFAQERGADTVAVADATAERLSAAEALGLEPIDERRVGVWQHCKQKWRHGPGDRGVDVVFQCRGQARCLQDALRSLRPQGVVVDLAFYQDGAGEVRLGEEFHHNGLAIRCAQIARVPKGLDGAWDRSRLAAECGELLLSRGGAIHDHIITDVVPFVDAPRVVADLAARRKHAIQVVFAFDGEGS